MSAPYISSGTYARFALAEPSSTRLTFTLTLTVAEWQGLLEQLPKDGCSQTLGRMIETMLAGLTRDMFATWASTGWSQPVTVASEDAS